MKIRCAFLLFALWLPAAASAALLFLSDFESPAYSTGALVPQNGWTDHGGSSVRDGVIANAVPGFGIAGAQTLAMKGGAGAAGWSRAPTWAGATGGTVWADMDILPDPAKTTGIFLGSVGAGAGAYLFFDAGGTIGVWDGAGMVTTGITYAERVYHVSIRLDIDADRYSVALDGATILGGLDARLTPGPVNPVEAFELFGDNSGSAANVSYIDNIVVSHVVPQPGTILLLGAGLLGFRVVRKRALSRRR